MPDHIHELIEIAPKHAVAKVIGIGKENDAIYIERGYADRKRNLVGRHITAGGNFVSTVGRDEQTIRQYIGHQESEDRRVDQLNILCPELPLGHSDRCFERLTFLIAPAFFRCRSHYRVLTRAMLRSTLSTRVGVEDLR